MKTVYQSWNTPFKELQSELDTISYLDIVNGTKYEKYFKKKERTLEEIVQSNHTNGLFYCVTAYDNEELYCFIEICHENQYIGVDFFDSSLRVYMNYCFEEVESMKKIFLREVWYHSFSNESTEDEDYRLHFVFDFEGNVSYRKYDDVNGKITDFESKQPLDATNLYEDYPEFGHYDGIMKLERNVDFLSNMLD